MKVFQANRPPESVRRAHGAVLVLVRRCHLLARAGSDRKGPVLVRDKAVVDDDAALNLIGPWGERRPRRIDEGALALAVNGFDLSAIHGHLLARHAPAGARPYLPS